MNVKTQADDTLTLELTKQHLYVDFDDDDILIGNQIIASLQAVEHYLNLQVLDTTYENTTEELTPFEDDVLKLTLSYKPHNITVTDSSGSTTYTEREEYYRYDNADGYLYVPQTDDGITAIEAVCGGVNTQSIDQARLLLVGNFYAFRENDVNTTINQLPTGATFLLDSLEGAVL